jgi:uroporphyrin-III C-methyltransferase
VSGRVVLIGAGPGDPELITVKGARALGEADVVIFDRLVAPALLDLCRPEVERFSVGKEPGRAAVPQERICSLLVEHAMAGRVVARLKGGEELLACARAGVPCEVIPGITSAVAAPAAAGIPVTHRGIARSFAVVTASTAGTAHAADAVDLGRVATAVDTLVLLMAAGKLEATCRALITAGRPSDEPAAIIQWATTPEERRVIATLEELPVLAAAAGIGPPATLVVGAVASIPAETAALAAFTPAGRP